MYAWREIQKQDKLVAGVNYVESGMIVTNDKGTFVEPRTFKDYYNRILANAGLGHFIFHALRHTFASRAMEQGMDAKTLSTILGHYSVAFTLDTYAHVLNDHKIEGMLLMEELFDVKKSEVNTLSYPIIITTMNDGHIKFEAPDFQELEPFIGLDMQAGLQYMKEQMQDEVLTSIMPISPTLPNMIQLEPNQMIIQLPI